MKSNVYNQTCVAIFHWHLRHWYFDASFHGKNPFTNLRVNNNLCDCRISLKYSLFTLSTLIKRWILLIYGLLKRDKFDGYSLFLIQWYYFDTCDMACHPIWHAGIHTHIHVPTSKMRDSTHFEFVIQDKWHWRFLNFIISHPHKLGIPHNCTRTHTMERFGPQYIFCLVHFILILLLVFRT